MSKTKKLHCVKEEPIFLTKDEREKVKSLAAGIETGKNRKLILSSFVVIALFMGIFQSGQIVAKLEESSPNLINDSVRVVAREWHMSMSRLGFVDVKDQMRDKVHTLLPNEQGAPQLINIDLKNGSSIHLRGPAQSAALRKDQGRVVEKEERTTTTFSRHRLRGSF